MAPAEVYLVMFKEFIESNEEWGSLLLNEEVKVVCDNQKATDWINTFFSSIILDPAMGPCGFLVTGMSYVLDKILIRLTQADAAKRASSRRWIAGRGTTYPSTSWA